MRPGITMSSRGVCAVYVALVAQAHRNYPPTNQPSARRVWTGLGNKVVQFRVEQVDRADSDRSAVR